MEWVMGRYLTPDTVLTDRRQVGHEINSSSVALYILHCCTNRTNYMILTMIYTYISVLFLKVSVTTDLKRPSTLICWHRPLLRWQEVVHEVQWHKSPSPKLFWPLFCMFVPDTTQYWHQNRSNFTSLLASQNVWNTGTNAEAWYLAQFIISVGSSNHTWSVNWVSVPVASIHQTEQPDSMWTSLTSNHNIGPGLSRKLFGFLSGNGATWCTVSCSQA